MSMPTIGIAFVTTMLARRRAYHTAVLTSHISQYASTSASYLESLRAAMIPLLFFMKRPEHVEVAMAGE
jgi:hypothetical protein